MKSEIKVVLFLIGCLLAGEWGTRWVEPELSKDVEHLEGLEAMAQRLEPRGKSNVLVLGNSLARCGLDQGLLSEGWRLPSGEVAQVEVLTPDASGIVDWGQGFRRYVVETGSRPEVVVVGTGRVHLNDPMEVQSARLAAWLVPKDERWAFVKDQKWGMEEAIPFWLASWSRLFANRERIEPLVFYRLVPGYEETSRLINHERGVALAGRSGGHEQGAVTTRHLQRLIDDVAKVGARLVVVTMPMPEVYELPGEVVEVLKANRVLLIEGGSKNTMEAERFPDGYHLDAGGARRFTTWLIERLNASFGDTDRR
jgi:hypothetical protein